MPEYSPTIDAGFVKQHQSFVIDTFTLPPGNSGISVNDMIQQCLPNSKVSDNNVVVQVSVTDSSGERCAIGSVVNGIFVPGEGFINTSCPVHSTAPTMPAYGCGTEVNSSCTCGFFPYLDYSTNFHVTDEPPHDPCNSECECQNSAAPVRYFDGKVIHRVQDIAGNGKMPWGHTRSYDNTLSYASEQHNGYRWQTDSLPHLEFFNDESSASFVKVTGWHPAVFRETETGFVVKNNGSEMLRHDEELAAYEVRWADGTTALFNDYSDDTAARGCIRSMTAPDEQSVTFFYNTDKALQKIQRTFEEDGQSVLEELIYDYTTGSDNITRIASVTDRRSTDNGTTWNDLKQVEYTYYGANDFHGSLGDLKSAAAKIRNGSEWVENGTYYYRYYKEGDANGFKHALKYILEPADYARFIGMQSLDAIDSQLAPYASNYFEYDAQRRVALEHIDGGQPASTFSYSEGITNNNPNHWAMKVTETLPDGSVKIVYSNAEGKTLLTDERPSANASGLQIVNHYVYDANGNQVQHNTPEVVNSYQDYAYGYDSELSVNLKANDGLIYKKTYYNNTADQPKGRLFREIVKRGNYGTEIVTAEYEYIERTLTDGAGNVLQKESFPTKITHFAGENRTLPSEIRFEYTFISGTLRVLEKRTIKPAVSAEQNGTAEEDAAIERYDVNGRVVWQQDEGGVITHHQYDAVNNWRTRTIQDVDVSRLEGTPNGWSSQADAKHLVSDFRYDSEGRIIEMLSPVVSATAEDGSLVNIRRVSWTVYDDVNRTTRSAGGSITFDEDGAVAAETLTNPVAITIRNAAGQVIEKITAFRDSCEGQLTAEDTFVRANYLTWEKNILSFGKTVAKRQYTVIPASGEGTLNQHYIETLFGYDCRGRQNKTVNPSGTITRTVIDWRGNTVQTWVGTNDTGATDISPQSNQNSNDMILVSESEFGGASSCTSCSGAKDKLRVAVQYVDSETMRVTELGYDWRGRQSYVFYEEDSLGNVIYDVQSYDNQDRIIKKEKFLLIPNDVQDPPSNPGNYGNYSASPSTTSVISTNLTADDQLLARTEQFYDVRGQVWKQEQSVVDPETGSVRGKLVSLTYYDAKGRVIRTRENRQNYVSEITYDSLGRQTASRVIGLDGVVLQQTETLYDAAGNVVFTAQAERTVDASGTGNLSLAAEPKGEFRHTGYWYDFAGRQIAAADYGISRQTSDMPSCIAARKIIGKLEHLIAKLQDGINTARQEFQTLAEAVSLLCGFTASASVIQTLQESAATLQDEELTEPQLVIIQLRGLLDTLYGELAVPDSSDTLLVSRTEYDTNTGLPVIATDPAGSKTRTEYDNFGRTVRTIANYKPGETGTDKNVTVEYFYSKTGQVLTLTAVNASTGNQVTQYTYDYLDRVVKEIYPDSGNSVDDCVTFEYNLANERVLKRDQNGSVHEYAYDNFGRLLSDTVSTLGNGVDGLVRRITTSYNTAGQVTAITSLDEEDSVVNQIVYTYDENGSLQREYTAHHGAVNTASTPFIEYSYDTQKDGDFFVNALRPVSVTYPSGKEISYQYDDYGRTVGIADEGNSLVEYAYQGLNPAVKTHYTEPGLTLDYTASDALDRFGRIIDHAWKNSSNQDVVRIKHGYDRGGNRLYRNDLVQAVNSELYTYDEVNQIKSLNRGALNANQTAVPTVNHAEAWNFDETGNWVQYNRNGSVENRTHNAANKIQSSVSHDANGNMTVMPNLNCKYDAWNRLTEVRNVNDVLLASYEYNALNQRVKKIVDNIETLSFFNHSWQEIESQTGSMLTSYVWGLRYIDDLILREKGEERLYSLADPNWNVVAICNANGVVQECYTYDAFGKRNVFNVAFVTKTGTDFDWNRTFTGQMLDAETGLMLYRNRYYHTILGRFVSRDPIGYEGGKNLFSYVINNPIYWLDPEGFHMTWAGWWAELSEMEDYVFYHCQNVCPCSKKAKNIVQESGVKAILETTNTVIWDDDSTRQHSALRHCIVSGLIAKELGNCACAACIIDTRDIYQYYYESQWIVSTQQALYNDREGRECAGCTGNYADKTPQKRRQRGKDGTTFTPATKPNLINIDDIVKCCKTKLKDGSLATGSSGSGSGGTAPSFPPKPDSPKIPSKPIWPDTGL